MIFGVALCSLLTGCGQSPTASPVGGRNQGRYAGIGVFEAGRLWSQMTVAKASRDPATATIADDEHVIVVVDSYTGEVRQCGDHSGYCVAMNPWNGIGPTVPVLPANLVKHAADLAADDRTNGTAKKD
jgi:hypothetical protein